ncbi:MAG TPA: hypothetical protein VMZ27_08420 [Candidatus Saccharimonadales bacterium]|nr:hypothetical protein [Candidatus Saccharimonadales bacterium]
MHLFVALPLFLWPLLFSWQACGAHPDLRFDFALIGDTPYTAEQETNLFPNMIAELNAHKLAFVVHDGDIKSGGAPCTDDVFHERFRQFQTFRNPLVYLFGDNEWSDCGHNTNHPFAPEERLQKLRELFTQGHRSLGQRTIALQRQSDVPGFGKYRENVRWNFGNILFAGLNVPGSDNHVGTPEYNERNAANLAWIRETFAIGRKDNFRALMFISQANPNFELAATNRARGGFNDMLRLFERESVAWERQVVYVHGDSHYFRIDQPLVSSVSHRRIENFTRAETYGNPDVHWLQVSVDWRDPNVFTFRPRHVRKNLVNHSAIPKK